MGSARRLILAAACGLGGPAAGAILPLIWPDSIPESMPAEVRLRVEQLYHTDREECMAAAHALGAMGPAAAPAAPFLATMLNDDVRWGARGLAMMNALVAIGPASVEPTIIVFQYGNNYARMRALEVFRQLRPPAAVPVIVSALADGLGGVGDRAIGVLTAIGAPALEYLKENADSQDPAVRRGVMLALPAFPAPAVIERLSLALTDKDESVQDAAAHALEWLLNASRDFVAPFSDPVRRALNDGTPAVRRTAIDLVMRTGREDWAAIVEGRFQDPDPGVRRKAIEAVSGLRKELVADRLRQLLEDPNPGTRRLAVETVGQMRGAWAVPILRRMAGEPDTALREKAVLALGQIGHPAGVDVLVEAMHDRDVLVRVRAADALGGVRDARAVDALSAALDDPDKGVRLEAACSLALYYTGRHGTGRREARELPANEAVPLYAADVRQALMKALGDPDIFVRETALGALLERRTPPDTAAAVAVLRDADAGLRHRALGFLVRNRATRDVPAEIVRGLLSDPSAGVRAEAIRLLDAMGDASAFEASLAALRQDRHLAIAGIEVLAHSGERGVEPLTEAVRHADAEVRRRAADALARMSCQSARKAVAAALGQRDEAVREAILGALSQGPREQRTPAVLTAMLRREPAAAGDRLGQELATLGAAAVEPVAVLFRDDNPQVRMAAVRVLSQIRDEAAAVPQLAALADPSPAVRAAALAVVRPTSEPHVVASAIAALNDVDPGVRQAAVETLARIGTPAAMDAVVGALRHPDWQTRGSAVRQLGARSAGAASRALVERLDDPHWYVRQAAAAALRGAPEADEVVARLIQAVGDEHWFVRTTACQALKNATGQDYGPERPEAWSAWWAGRGTNPPTLRAGN